MISDTLSQAVQEIREYLENPATANCYSQMRDDIMALADAMDAMRERLDNPYLKV